MDIEQQSTGEIIDEQSIVDLVAQWYEGETQYQFSRISPEASVDRLYSQSFSASEGFGGEIAQRYARYQLLNNGGDPALYPTALQALAKAANCARSLYLVMLLVQGEDFNVASQHTTDLVREQGVKAFDFVEPRQLDYTDFFNTSAGLGIAYLSKSFLDEGVMAEGIQEKQLSLARGIFLDMTSLTVHRIKEIQKETSQLLLPKPGVTSGEINLER